jgi:uncharacterized domain 1
MTDRQPVMTPEELDAFLHREFPQTANDWRIESVGPMTARVWMTVEHRHLRPGGTVSGPSLFALADCAFYIVVLAMIGPVALTVTTNCSIDFMRKPPPEDLVADARLLKLGRTLAVGDVVIHAPSVSGGPVARASLTYAIPPKG